MNRLKNLIGQQQLWVWKIPLAILVFFLFLFLNSKLALEYHDASGYAGVLKSDAHCYYEYLPAVHIRQQPLRMKTGMRLRPGVSVNKVSYGVALMEAPFFFANFQVQTWRGFSGTGFENSYGYSVLVAASLYAYLGFLMLFSLLRNWFGWLTAMVSVLALCFGTNFYHYIYAEPGLAHVYSFFCISGILYFTDRYYKNPSFGLNLFMVSFLLALAVLVRPIDIFAVLIFICYNCYSWTDFKNRFWYFIKNFRIILLFALTGFVLFLPQFYYWYLTTDKWFVFSYGLNNEKFEYLTNPKFAEAFFSHRGGWLTYAQIMVISVICLPILLMKKRFNGLTILLVFLPFAYLCASWWAVNFMCAHGYRSYIDFYPLLAIPLAYGLNALFTARRLWIKLGSSLVIAGLIYLSVRFTLDFYPHITCDDPGYTFYEYVKQYDRYF